MIEATYPEVVREAARLYAGAVRNVASADTNQARSASLSNLATLLEAVAGGAKPSIDDLKFSARTLAGLPKPLAENLVNQWTLGWGRDDAPVIVMGTEEAYSIDPPEGLAQWNCGNALIWATGGDHRFLDALDAKTANPVFGCPEMNDPAWSARRREFHIYNSDYVRVQLPSRNPVTGKCRRSGRNTWKMISEAIAGPGAWRQLLAPYTGGLGDLCYQIEVSAYPAETAVGGVSPSASRIEFLKFLVTRLRPSAKVLIFHGRPGAPEWGGRDQIAAAFLGTEVSTITWDKISGADTRSPQSIWSTPGPDPRVVLTRALNGPVRGDLLASLHLLIAQTIRDDA